MPQVYVGFPSATGEPPKQLKGYTKVGLAPGASKRLTLTLDARAFSTWSASAGWHVVRGTYHVAVGSSSCDLRLGSTIRM